MWWTLAEFFLSLAASVGFWLCFSSTVDRRLLRLLLTLAERS
jgi:hypothetical protein